MEKNKKVYVAYLSDRHVDPVIGVYSKQESAIRRAREFMESNMAHPGRIKERYYEGYLLYLSYGEESDCAYVVESDFTDE